MDKKHWTLLAIYYASTKGLSPVQLQKSLFVFGKHMHRHLDCKYYNFTPYNYGPFDQQVYLDAESLSTEKYVDIQSYPDRKWPLYMITPPGADFIKGIETKLPSDATKYLKEVVEWAQGLSFQKLVRTIYAHYPEYKANSVFRE